jgi:hypothetical protein
MAPPEELAQRTIQELKSCVLSSFCSNGKPHDSGKSRLALTLIFAAA